MADARPDWSARARREAAAIIAEAGITKVDGYGTIVTLVAIGWLQGATYGAHETLALTEDAFARLRADVTA